MVFPKTNYIVKTVNGDRIEPKKTLFDFILLRKKAIKNIPRTFPYRSEAIILIDSIKFSC